VTQSRRSILSRCFRQLFALTSQSYWHVVAPGKETLYGFVFGCYDLTQFIFMPIFGYLSESIGLRWTIICALILNVVGNIIYSFALYTNSDPSSPNSVLGTYSMVIVGRLIAGIGSSALGLGVVYLTLTTTIAERRDSIGVYRISQVSVPAWG
jgi:MFS family permease